MKTPGWDSKLRIFTGTLQTEGYKNSVVSMYYGPCLYKRHKIETTGLLSWEPN